MEYKRESFEMFEAMMERFEEEAVRYLYLMQVLDAEDMERLQQEEEAAQEAEASGTRRQRTQTATRSDLYR